MLPQIWSVSICSIPVPVLILIFLSLGLNTMVKPLFFPLPPTSQELESANAKASKFATVNVSESNDHNRHLVGRCRFKIGKLLF